jgi:hypothetical protein
MHFSYANRFVALVDVLGHRRHLASGSGRTYARNFAEIVEEILRRESRIDTILRHTGKGRPINITFRDYQADVPSMQITSISDSIVVSIPKQARFHGRRSRTFNLLILVETVFWIQRNLMELGILTRGSITSGELHHTPSTVIGTALVRAYELERQSAIFPRVILDRGILSPSDFQIPEDVSLLEQLGSAQSRLSGLVTHDLDGFFFVDYLNEDYHRDDGDWHPRIRRVERLLSDLLRGEADLRVQQKLSWLSMYVERTKTRLLQNDDRPAKEKRRANHPISDYYVRGEIRPTRRR